MAQAGRGGLDEPSIYIAPSGSRHVPDAGGALFAAGGTASAAPSQPTDQSSDLQHYLDSLTNAYNNTIGHSVDEVRDSAYENTQANIATAIGGVPVANGAIGGATAVAGSAVSAVTYSLIQNALNPSSSAAPPVAFFRLQHCRH